MNIHEAVLKDLRNPKLYLGEIVNYVETRIKYVFGIACEKKMSINEWQPDASFGKQIGQKTVLLTVRMFDLWETAIIDVLNKQLSRYNVRVIPSHDAIGDMIILFPDNTQIRWEIKTSQASDSFTGATHSASKCNNYILVNYSINRDVKLSFGENKGFIKDIAVFVWDNMSSKWQGKPTNHSSFTTLKIPAKILGKRKEIVVVGELIPKKKWCKIGRKSLIVDEKTSF